MKIKLNGVKKDFVIVLVLGVPQICSLLTNQMVTRVSQNYPHLKNLRLADSFDEQLMNTSSCPEVFCEKGACSFLINEFCEISKNTFLYRTPLVSASI